MTASPASERYAAVQRTLWGVLAFNIGLSLLKLTAGLTAGALSVVADGFHSSSP